MPAHGALDQILWIEQMLGFEMLSGPAAAVLKLNAEEMTDIPKHAISNNSDQFAVAIRHGDGCTRRDFLFYLEADSGKRDVFQIGDSPSLSPGLIVPDHFHQFRTK